MGVVSTGAGLVLLVSGPPTRAPTFQKDGDFEAHKNV